MVYVMVMCFVFDDWAVLAMVVCCEACDLCDVYEIVSDIVSGVCVCGCELGGVVEGRVRMKCGIVVYE